FTGGMMPSENLPLYFQKDLVVERTYRVGGRHYARTCRHWLARLDSSRDEVLAALREGDNPAPAEIQLQRWRLFFLACEELFAYRGGDEWYVGHYLFRKRQDTGALN